MDSASHREGKGNCPWRVQTNRGRTKKDSRAGTSTPQFTTGTGRANGNGAGGIEGENISEFIWHCEAVSEMVKRGWLTQGIGSEYKWHQASSNRSCENLRRRRDNQDLLRDNDRRITKETNTRPVPSFLPVSTHRLRPHRRSG